MKTSREAASGAATKSAKASATSRAWRANGRAPAAKAPKAAKAPIKPKPARAGAPAAAAGTVRDGDAPDDIPSVMASVAEPIARHPDGWYWTAPDGRQQFGPFRSYEDAFADMHSGDPDDLEPGESLREAESELGIADWIDPDTGAPAEGMGHPHLEE